LTDTTFATFVCRVFYKILKNTLDPDKFAVTDSWTRSVKLASIAFNTWNADMRPPLERVRYPKILDVGWVEVTLTDLMPQSNLSTHIIMSENHFLANKGMKKSVRGLNGIQVMWP
jgi:hypothetical protein